jgi:two-component sensor histidine kinase
MEGVSLPELNIHKNQSFGLQMITAFAQKLKAQLDFYNDNGASVSMQIKKFRFAGA